MLAWHVGGCKMPLTQAQRQQTSWLAIYTGVAEGLLAAAEANAGVLPSLTGTPLEVGWQTLWQFRADDDPNVIQWLQGLFGLGKRSWFYGLLLQCSQNLPDIGYGPGDLLPLSAVPAPPRNGWTTSTLLPATPGQRCTLRAAWSMPDSIASIKAWPLSIWRVTSSVPPRRRSPDF
jgi:hypothetical protein